MTTFGVEGQWEASLLIGGMPFPINPSTVPTLNLISTVHQNLPSLQLTLMDTEGEFAKILAQGDGTPIALTLGDGKSGITTADLIIQGNPHIKHGASAFVCTISAVANAVSYMRKIPKGPYEGTANGAIKKLASEAGLSFQGDSTADKQVWLPNGKPIAGMVKNIMHHAWNGDSSAFVNAVTPEKKLILKDLGALKGASGEMFGGPDAQIPMLDWQVVSKGGAANHNRGGGSTSVGFDSEGVVKELNKVPVKLLSNSLGLGAATAAALGDLGGKIDSIVRSAGNTHEKFHEAVHQGTRIRSQFNLDLIVLSDIHSGAELLSVVGAVPPSFSAKKIGPMPEFSGSFVVSAKTQSLTRSRYFERITLTTQGGS